jgi:putative methionine-R-sulfoxide reductase with GAF domain
MNELTDSPAQMRKVNIQRDLCAMLKGRLSEVEYTGFYARRP